MASTVGSITYVCCNEPKPGQTIDHSRPALDRNGGLPGALFELPGLQPAVWQTGELACPRCRAQTPPERGGGKPDQSPPGRLNTVTLDESKFAVAKIKLDEVRLDQIATGVSVVGQIQANMDKQVEIRPRSSGFVRNEVPAVLGQHVNRGDVLVTLDSPEIGTARLNLRARQRELATARFEAGWKSEIARNLALLIPDLKQGITERRETPPEEDHGDQPPRPTPARAGRRTLPRTPR